MKKEPNVLLENEVIQIWISDKYTYYCCILCQKVIHIRMDSFKSREKYNEETGNHINACKSKKTVIIILFISF